MKTPLITLLVLFVGPAIAAEDSVCPRDVENLNTPGIVFGSTTFECDASPVPPGHLNECGILNWAAKTMPRFLAVMKEHLAYVEECEGTGVGSDCGQGKFSPGHLMTELRLSAAELPDVHDDPNLPRSVSIDQACELFRRGVAAPKKPHPPFLSERLSLTRGVPDPKWSRGKPFESPFLINASQDRRQDKSYVGIYGTVSYRLHDVAGQHALSVFTKLDTAADSEREKSSVSFGVNWVKHYFPENNPWIDNVLLRISPEYLTDRGFDREAYQLSLISTWSSRRFGRPGFLICPGGCGVENSSEFYWSPTLGLQAGKVVDAAGSSSLQRVQDEGSYVRFVPGITMTYKPVAWSENLAFQLQYDHLVDLSHGWDRGLGSLSVNYQFSPNAFWSLTWRKGWQDTTAQSLDTLLLGIGIRQ